MSAGSYSSSSEASAFGAAPKGAFPLVSSLDLAARFVDRGRAAFLGDTFFTRRGEP